MNRHIWSIFVLLVCCACCQCIVQEIFEFEDALSEDQQDRWVWRSEASNRKTLRVTSLNGTTAVSMLICILPRGDMNNVTFYIDNVRYGNDGPSDEIVFKFEGVTITEIESFEKWHSGHEWNVFRNTGQKGPLINLLAGEYKLDVFVKTDEWGMELDSIRINTEHQLRAQPIVCDAIAFPDDDN